MSDIIELGRLPWTKKDGTRVTLADLDCGHLNNIARMLKRVYARQMDEAAMAVIYDDQGGNYMDLCFDRAHKVEVYRLQVLRYIKLREEAGFILEGPK